MGDHLIDGTFQSDKYPTTPRGKVPLSVKDPTAQDVLWIYAQRRRAVDASFSADLEEALRLGGFDAKQMEDSMRAHAKKVADAIFETLGFDHAVPVARIEHEVIAAMAAWIAGTKP